MKQFICACDGVVFFENTQCLSCGKELGWCPECTRMTALERTSDGKLQCANSECGALLVKCHNYGVEKVCNRCCAAQPDSDGKAPLCDYCRFNDTIPDLSIAGNREMWARLEAAKRRLLYTLDLLKLPYGSRKDGFEPVLSFDFKADATQTRKWWWSMGKEERVYTGHANGKITINLREADTVEREKSRVMFQEAHRTVIGHFRHEIGHYYWQMLIADRAEADFIAVFGDHRDPGYADAQQAYYKDGPRSNWQAGFISAYATMHPWEDFAETFAAYLDMVSVLDTAHHMNLGENLDPATAELSVLVSRYMHLGVVLNEMNRSMGLLDLVPEVFVAPVIAKLDYIHKLVQQARNTVVPVAAH
jgi:hypothetical protein